MAEFITSKYGTFEKIAALGDCGGCHFDNRGDCTKPTDFEFRCTTPKDVIFQLITSSSAPTRVGKVWNLTDGNNYVVAIKSAGHNKCTGCCFIEDCNTDAYLPEHIDCSDSSDEIIFLLNGERDKLYVHPELEIIDEEKEDNNLVIGQRMTTKDGGSVLCVPSGDVCAGCFFNNSSGCTKNEYLKPEDDAKGCVYRKFIDYHEPLILKYGPGIVPAMEFKKEYPITFDEAFKETETLIDRDPLILKDGTRVVFAKEHNEGSCEGCYFKKSDCNFSNIGIGDHEGLIVLCRDLPGSVGKMSLDIGLDHVSKPTPNMSLKKEKKFSI